MAYCEKTKVTTYVDVVKTVQEERIVTMFNLTLTEEETTFLRSLCAVAGGCPTYSDRRFMDDIRISLDKAGATTRPVYLRNSLYFMDK